ncbi:MAG: hypothetical protein OXD42_14555 [Rhodospirillaceae bacterium]|nr:hypothetical protein [Rhodospirillaceae bacterium]
MITNPKSFPATSVYTTLGALAFAFSAIYRQGQDLPTSTAAMLLRQCFHDVQNKAEMNDLDEKMFLYLQDWFEKRLQTLEKNPYQ